jgi:hypothetical protein
VVVGLVQHGGALLAARGLGAIAVGQQGEAADLVERDPVLHLVAELLDDGVGIAREGVHGGAGGPAAAVFQRLRQVPVEERHPRRDAVLRHAGEKTVIEVQAGLVQLAVTVRVDARPGDRQAIGLDAQRGHQREVLVEAVVVVAGDVERVAAGDLAGDSREAIPDGFALAVLEGGAFDLGRGRGHAEDEGGGERTGVREHRVLWA